MRMVITKMALNSPIEKVMGIEVFEWTGWDEIDGFTLQFYEVTFHIDELKKYNGHAVSVNFGWNTIKVFDGNSNIEIDLMKCESFVKKLLDRSNE